MSTLTEIEAAVETLPRPDQETLLRHLAVRLSGEARASFSIAEGADGLPVIRAQGGVITAAMVREIEGAGAVIRLLDVNVLMALLWENHEHHEPARRWLRTVTEFATCPVSQLGFARISAHPMLGFGLSPEQAFGVLRRFLADPRHRFVPDDLSCADRVLLTERIPGSNHVTDHYLAALARQHGLALATFDEALSGAFPEEPGLLELVP